MKRFVVILIMSLGFLWTFSLESQAKEKTVGAFRYEYETLSKNTCCITKASVVNKKKPKTMKIPDKLDGKKVVRIGDKDSDGYEYQWNVFGVKGNDEDGTPTPTNTYEATKGLKKVVLPKYLKAINEFTFSELPNLEKMTINSTDMKGIEVLCFPKWKSFKITKKNKYYKVKDGMLLSKNGKAVYGQLLRTKNIKIPNGVKTIKEYAFWGYIVDSIYIPKSVNSIEDFAFRTIEKVELKVSKKNKRYAMSGDCLYSKKSGRLVAAINRNGKLVIPSVVTKLKGGASSIGGEFKKIVIPKSVKLLGGGWDAHLLKYGGALYFKSAKIPKVEEGGMSEYTVLYVPKKATTKYYYEFAELNVDVRAWD